MTKKPNETHDIFIEKKQLLKIYYFIHFYVIFPPLKRHCMSSTQNLRSDS